MQNTINKDIDTSYENLAVSIIQQTADDYFKAMKSRDKANKTLNEIDEFFRSDYAKDIMPGGEDPMKVYTLIKAEYIKRRTKGRGVKVKNRTRSKT